MPHDGAPRVEENLQAISAASREDSAPSIDPDDPAVQVICLAFSQGEQRLRQCTPDASRGDAEGVHQTRTATRRLRSNLKLFRDLLVDEWADHLGDELRWLGRLLGAVRDLDVLRERLRKASGDLAGDLVPLFAALGEQHATASAALREALGSERLRLLLEQLSEAAEHPACRDEAWEPCRSTLPPLVHHSWKRLRKPGHALDLNDADEDYHEVRKRAKHARYSAECVLPALDHHQEHAARRYIKCAHAVQDILGEHQDAIVAGEQIRRIAAERPHDGTFGLAAGRLLERQQIAASESRSRFFKAWNRLDRKKNHHWMRV
jgi:CHAD domain-containing protein